jgi:hypothetical protein
VNAPPHHLKESKMSATLESLGTWSARNVRLTSEVYGPARTGRADLLDRNGARYHGDYTRIADARPLREVAAQQGAMLRAALATGTKTPTEQRIAARVAKVRAEQNAPAPKQTPKVAPVAARPTYKQIDALAASIPTGFYALPKREDATNANQPTYYFKIHEFRGGHRIVMVTGGVGAFVEIPMKTAWQWVALQKIAADAKGAAARFGRETSTCGRCNSPLTNDASRARGLGPKCANAY